MDFLKCRLCHLRLAPRWRQKTAAGRSLRRRRLGWQTQEGRLRSQTLEQRLRELRLSHVDLASDVHGTCRRRLGAQRAIGVDSGATATGTA